MGRSVKEAMEKVCSVQLAMFMQTNLNVNYGNTAAIAILVTSETVYTSNYFLLKEIYRRKGII